MTASMEVIEDMTSEKQRKDRFRHVRSYLEADGPDRTVPGASKNVDRYCVVTSSTRGFGHFTNYASDLEHVELVAAANIDEGWIPVCYYDLDILDGPEQLPLEVVYNDIEWMVHGPEYTPGGEGTTTGKWVLKKSPDDRRRRSYDWAIVDPSECDLMGWEDEHLPVRYEVASVRTIVVFNTLPQQQ